MTKLIFVKAPPMSTRVALAEVHSDHPGGEVWVAGSEINPREDYDPVQVAETAFVKRQLANGSLVLVPAPAKKRRAPRKKKVEPEPEPEESPVVVIGPSIEPEDMELLVDEDEPGGEGTPE